MAALRSLFLLAATSLSFVGGLHAQSNVDPAIDVRLAEIRDLQMMGRLGTFPTGRNGLSMETTICNVGTVTVDWFATMNLRHPFIAFLTTRVANGRMVQISDRSYLKHGNFAANKSTLCATCIMPPGVIGTLLGLGCSDTYKIGINGNRLHLGPADEIDPWLGIWDRTCSHFDRGEPAVGAPNNCDDARSLTQAQVDAMDPVTHRIEVADAELNTPGLFYYQASYIVSKEAEAARDDDLGSRRFIPNWNGLTWTFTTAGPLIYGSVLQRLEGASVASNTNGGDDGRVYIALSGSGPVQGKYHYEYALHNRDNGRGVSEIRIPFCPGASLSGFGFRDIDANPANDWTASIQGDELVVSTSTNPLRWNTIYNVWFDSDAAPLPSTAELGAFDPGPGAASFGVATFAPLGRFNVPLGGGCAAGTPPSLYATGTPAQAVLGNTTFAIESAGNVPGARNLLRVGTGSSTSNLQGCTLWTGTLTKAMSTTTADAGGVAVHAFAIPNSSALEGLELNVQCTSILARSGKLARFELSDGLRIRIGNSVVGCP